MSCPVCRLCQQQEEKPVCSVCGTLKNLWICLICGFVGCGRYEKGHASGHWSDKKHHFSLELEKQQIWDYVGDRYVHQLNQSKVDRKSVGSKSNGVNLRCSSTKECGTCGNYEESLSGALFNSKVDAVLDEYNHLLASQLEIQRQKNQELTKKQELLQSQLKEIQERERSTLKSKDEKIADLQEQIRDLKIYVEAQKTFTGMTYSNDMRGGTILPLEPNQPSSANSKTRSNKSGRRRRN